jgi:site-specific DNA-methyltransferase (adenine-specific)
MIELNKIYNADCLEIMKSIPDKSINLVLTDPPYGIKMDKRGLSNRASNSVKYKGYKGKNYEGTEWDSTPPTVEYFKELFRISKNQIIFGANHFISKIPFDSPCWIVWHKNGQNPNATNADCELAWTSFNTAVRYFYYEWSGFGFINNGEKDKFHPTQKPAKLFEWCLLNYSEEGQTVLDCFSGSGTTAIACIRTNRNYICIEKDKEYFEKSMERVAKESIKIRMAI